MTQHANLSTKLNIKFKLILCLHFKKYWWTDQWETRFLLMQVVMAYDMAHSNVDGLSYFLIKKDSNNHNTIYRCTMPRWNCASPDRLTLYLIIFSLELSKKMTRYLKLYYPYTWGHLGIHDCKYIDLIGRYSRSLSF